MNLADMEYGELLDLLRKDLQLNLATDALPGSASDSVLRSPSNSVPRLRLQASGVFLTAQGASTFYLTSTNPVVSGATTTAHIPSWRSNIAGEFTVPNLSAFCTVRVSWFTNATAPATTFTVGLYQPSASGGAAGLNALTLGNPAITGSTVAIASPAVSSSGTAVSAAFAIPIVPTPLIFAVNVPGTPVSGSSTSITAQLYSYNA